MNMSYCRFENTLGDLQDCLHHLDPVEKLSGIEKESRIALVRLCQEIAEMSEDVEDLEEYYE